MKFHFCALILCLSVCWTVEHSVTAAEGMLDRHTASTVTRALIGGITYGVMSV